MLDPRPMPLDYGIAGIPFLKRRIVERNQLQFEERQVLALNFAHGLLRRSDLRLHRLIGYVETLLEREIDHDLSSQHVQL